MGEEYEIYRGYILAPGIQMPSYDIYETSIFESREQFELGNSIHTSESVEEAKAWLDTHIELDGGAEGKAKEKSPSDLEGHLMRLTELQVALDKTLDEPRNSFARTITRPRLIGELKQAVDEARDAGMTDDDVNELVAELEVVSGRRPIELENFWDPARIAKGWREGGSGSPDKVPEHLLKKYPWLKGTPKSMWIRFWEFPGEPPKLGGSMPWALEQVEKIYQLPLTKEEKYLKWAEVITDKYYSGLLTEEEKTEYLQWEFGW